MADLFSQEQIELMQASSSSIWMGCSSSDKQTDIVRLTGVLVENEILKLFAPERQVEVFLRFIDENPRMSFLCSSIVTFEALQVKGRYLNHRQVISREEQIQRDFIKGFTQSVAQVGVKNAGFFQEYLTFPTIAIEMRAEEVFDQTPRGGAGKRINHRV